MYLYSNDEGRPFLNNEEVLEEYQVLLDYIFDYALDEEIGLRETIIRRSRSRVSSTKLHWRKARSLHPDALSD